MESIHDSMHFIQLGGACFFGHGWIFYGADQEVFGRVGEIHELQKLCFISHAGQQITPDRIGRQRRHALFYDAVARKQGELIRVHLPIELMLAAGYGKDHVRIPADGVVQCIIRGGVTGMERHDHIHIKGSMVAIDIA